MPRASPCNATRWGNSSSRPSGRPPRGSASPPPSRVALKGHVPTRAQSGWRRAPQMLRLAFDAGAA
eukprot:1725427-Pyramimonas_sp.AAC.1